MTQKRKGPGHRHSDQSPNETTQRQHSTPSEPQYPGYRSVAGRALARFLLGDRLTHHQFQNQTGSYRLAQYVHTLKQRYSWDVQRESYKQSVRDGDKAEIRTFCRYWIDGAVIRAAGIRGEEFVKQVQRFERPEGAV